jgi:hypothetical protein
MITAAARMGYRQARRSSRFLLYIGGTHEKAGCGYYSTNKNVNIIALNKWVRRPCSTTCIFEKYFLPVLWTSNPYNLVLNLTDGNIFIFSQ